MARGELQPSWIRHFQFQCLRDLRRWRPDGGCGERSCFARGTSEALQSLLDLRQQQGDPRWSRRVVLQRRCADAFQGLRLERRARDGRQRFGPPGARLRQFSQVKRPANAHCCGQPHWVRIAPQARFLRSTWRAAGRDRSQTRKEKLWMARRREVSGPRWGLLSVQEWRGQARSRGWCGVERKVRGVQETISAARRSAEQDAERPIARRLGQRLAELPCRSKGHGDARVLRKNAERPSEEYPLAGWRIGRPGQVQQ